MYVLQKFEIERQSFGDDKGKYKCRIQFTEEGNYNHFTLQLSPETANRVKELVVDELTAENIKLIEDLRRNFLEGSSD